VAEYLESLKEAIIDEERRIKLGRRVSRIRSE
jgi:hypothetical protein